MKVGKKVKRQIIRIDEEKCNGCGLCIPACAEGALKIIDGKARLVSELYCDGLGACLGVCPEDAITIEEREALEFDQQAVEAHKEKAIKEKSGEELSIEPPCCPASVPRKISTLRQQSEKASEKDQALLPSSLSNWPVQIKLVPVQAPFLDNAKLLISADCVPFAFNNFHQRFLSGKVVMVGCPKLDDAEFYLEKLTQIFLKNQIQEIEVAYMEVPCCSGLVRIVKIAIDESRKEIPLRLTRIGINGEILDSQVISGEAKEAER